MRLGRVSRFWRLSGHERARFVRAYVALGEAEVGLRLLGLRRFLTRIERTPVMDEGTVTREDLVRAEDYARWLATAARFHPTRARCLHRSLALHAWLRRERLPGRFKIGVRKQDGVLAAHAWIELSGVVVNDTPAAVSQFSLLAHAEPLHFV